MQIVNRIEELQEKDYYVIDVFPKGIQKDNYSKIEQYFLDTYIKEYAKKVCRIVVLLHAYYDFDYYVTEFPSILSNKGRKFAKYSDRHVKHLEFKELSKLIEFVITTGVSSVEIINLKNNFLISINGDFSTVVYHVFDEDKQFIESIVQREGLYFRSIKQDKSCILE